jgi:alkylation response protein AidB-like acyl-CoA dehydrogenase
LISFELTEEQRLAQSMVQELASSTLRPAARDADDRESIPGSILEQGGDATKQSQLAYTYAGEQAMWIADEGVQMLGGHGYLRDNPVEMWYRNTRTVSVLEGAVGV